MGPLGLDGLFLSAQDHQRSGLDLEEALPGRKHILGSSPKVRAPALEKSLPPSRRAGPRGGPAAPFLPHVLVA